METKNNKPDIVQAFDFFVDREYYKIIPGFFFSSKMKVRADQLKDWKEWFIECKDLPDKITVNGKGYKLVLDELMK